VNFCIPKKTGLYLALLMVPLCIDGVANLLGIWSTSGGMRSITGMLCGIPLPLFLFFIHASSIDLHPLYKVNLLNVIVPGILSLSFLLLLTFTQSFFIFYSLAVVAATGMLLIFLNMLITFFKIIFKMQFVFS